MKSRLVYLTFLTEITAPFWELSSHLPTALRISIAWAWFIQLRQKEEVLLLPLAITGNRILQPDFHLRASILAAALFKLGPRMTQDILRISPTILRTSCTSPILIQQREDLLARLKTM